MRLDFAFFRVRIPAAAVAFTLVAGCTGPAAEDAAADAPAEPAAAPVPAAAAAEPVLGEYACDEGHWNVSAGRMEFEPRGYFVLREGGVYRWLDDGGEGGYRYDPDAGTIAWLSGPLADRRPEATTYRRNERTTQVDIRLADGVEWSCGHNLDEPLPHAENG